MSVQHPLTLHACARTFSVLAVGLGPTRPGSAGCSHCHVPSPVSCTQRAPWRVPPGGPPPPLRRRSDNVITEPPRRASRRAAGHACEVRVAVPGAERAPREGFVISESRVASWSGCEGITHLPGRRPLHTRPVSPFGQIPKKKVGILLGVHVFYEGPPRWQARNPPLARLPVARLLG